MVRLSAIIISLLLIFSFQVQAKNPPPGTGTSDIPANILIMLDNSGSMSAKLYASVEVYYPLDTATDSSGNVYVLEYHNSRIKVFDSSGKYLRSFGSNGYGCNQWRYARQFDIYNDEIYLADTYNHQTIRMSLTGQCIAKERTAFNYPHAIAAHSTFVYVGYTSWSGHGRYISAVHRNRMYASNTIDTGYSSGLRYAWGMSLNSGGNRLIVADYSRNQLYEYSISNYSSTRSAVNLSLRQRSNSSYSSSNGYFQRPTDAAYDSSGNIYALDLYGHRLQKFNSSLVYQAKVGTYSTTSGFRYPYGMHIDSNNKIYVTDYYNYAVRQYDTSLTETATFGGGAGTRLSAAKKVIKKIVSNTDLTSGANFGLME